MVDTYKYGITDLSGHPVPDSRLSQVGRDMIDSTGVFDIDMARGVYAYFYDNNKKPVRLDALDTEKYIVKFIAGLWRIREKPTKSYSITTVYDRQFVLGPEIKINERDDFNFKYYQAGLVHYDLFGVLIPQFDWVVAKCNTIRGPVTRYGATRAEARAFLRGAIMDNFASKIANIVLEQNLTSKEKE